jgi:hypothetical protein
VNRAKEKARDRGHRGYIVALDVIHDAFLSVASVAAILASVALLVVLSALTLAPFDKFGRYSTVAFLVSLLAIWAGAVFTILLIRHTIV